MSIAELQRLNPLPGGPLGPASVEDDLAALSGDPLRFVLWAFPWGEPGELARFSGPEPWQVQILSWIRDGLLTPNRAIQLATASGHGVGKSALVSWIVLWAFTTFEDCKGVVTANTETQLKTKTWSELGKWFRLFLARDLFSLTATALFSRDPDRERTWRIDMVPWSERNTEAFAGLHNQGKRILLVMDEASAIPSVIWETAEGALTDADTQIIWCVFGNPTRVDGRFRDCFPGGRFASAWQRLNVDSREVAFTNKAQFDRWIALYGEDSDFVRVRVKGTFPRTGMSEFISIEAVAEAAVRETPPVLRTDPLVLGVDVARFGDDESVIFFRKGRDARSIAPIRLRNVDTVALASRVAAEVIRLNADAVFVDGGGVGGGVVDNLRAQKVFCFDVQFGAKPDYNTIWGDDGERYAQKRAELWGHMRAWLATGTIPDDPDLRTQLAGPQYGFNIRNEIQLERKEDMKDRGLPSPDLADALALTFALPVQRHASAGGEFPHPPLVQSEYDPFASLVPTDYNPFAAREPAQGYH